MAANIAAAGSEPFEARLRKEYDMSWADDLRDRVLMRAQAIARSYGTDLFPPGASGQVRYLHLVAHLSEVLLPKRWDRCNDANIPRLIHKERKIALVVTSGDKATGQPWSAFRRLPRSKYPKGTAVQKAVELNSDPFLPFFGEEAVNNEPINLAEYETRFLVVYVSTRTIQSEISTPNGTDAKGYVCKWKEDRLLLPNLPNDGIAIDIVDESDDSTSGDTDDIGWIDVPVDLR